MTAGQHPLVDEWARLLDGEVTANRAAQMEAHAATCADCEREIAQLAGLIGEIERPIAEVDQAAVSAIMRRLDDTPAANRPRVWWYSAAAVASAAAVLLVVSLADPGRSAQDPGTFTARGGGAGSGDELSRKVGFQFFAGAGAETELSGGASITADMPLTASYRNVAERPAFALIFAVDAAGDVHWLYPAFTDPDTDPASVQLLPGQRAGQFGETVLLAQPAPGSMRLVTVVSAEPLAVSAIEQLDGHTTERLRKSLPKASVTSIGIEVAP